MLHNLIDHQARSLPLGTTHARWVSDRLHLPPLDVLPAGYGVTRGTPSSFSAILRAVVDAPLIALVMGAVVAGLYVDPLGRQSFMIHLNSPSSRGKTTALQCAAAVVGQSSRGGVVEPWTGTANGLIVWLRQLAVLPGFRDEIQALALPPRALQQMVFSALEGARKITSTREGGLNQPSGGWAGALISTGNEGIVTRIANVGIAARVIEIHSALTTDSRQSKTLKRLSTMGHGHGLAAIIDGAISPEAFAARIDRAEADLGMPEGGPEERVAEHIASAIAGARLLGDVFGVAGVGDAAMAGGRHALGMQLEGMAERGGGEGGQLLAGLAEWEMSEPTAFPTRPAYAEMLRRGDRSRIEVAGWTLRGVDEVPADLAVLPGRLRERAERLGIADVTTALQEIDRMGKLHRTPGKLQSVLRIDGKPTRVYLLRHLVDDDLSAEPAVPADPPADSAPVDAAPQPAALLRVVDMVSVADIKLPCETCGEPCLIRVNGRVLHGGCAERGTPPPAPAQMELPEPEPEPARPALRLVRSTEPAGMLGPWLLDNGHPSATPEQLAAAEELWLSLLRGVPFRGPYETAKRLLNGGLKHHSIPPLPEHDRELVADVVSNRWRADTWMVPGDELTPGTWINSFDVNGMYPSAADIELGLGDPVRSATLPDGWQRLPGYVRYAGPLEGLPYGLEGRYRPGAYVPIPIAGYLAERGAQGTVEESVVWPKHGRRLRSHVAMYRSARSRLMARRGDPVADMVMDALKATGTRMFGAVLRSARLNKTPTLRLDWSDMIVSTGQARMLRAVDKTTAQVAGFHVDAVWFIGQAAREVPHGLVVPEDPTKDNYRQLGKFKPHRATQVTAELAEAHRVGRWKPIFEALEASK
ncbi:DUF927 domain-containing protein (plasmid) [Micromonospora sp. NBC_01405]|uniref:DUF927 domain-containing protein n=1 Tax=Micromonospora sp. NBC_01405 TaxID=2903589 RepID=UPI003243AD3B